MKNLGILIDHPGHSQKFKCITEEIAKLPSDINTTIFMVEPGVIPSQTNFPVLNLVYAYDFCGTLISTDVYTTLVLNNCLRPKKRYFYVWDLEYLYQPFNFADLQKIFANPKIELIARNEFRHDLLSRTWKEPKFTMENFNHERLQHLL